MQLTATCETCKVREDCKHAFGRFWGLKSSDGKGCLHPFPGWPKNENADIDRGCLVLGEEA